MYNLREKLYLVFLVIGLSACSDSQNAQPSPTGPTPNSSVAASPQEGVFRGSNRQAVSSIVANRNLIVDVRLGSANSPDSTSIQTRFMNITAVTDRISQPWTVNIQLDDSPASRAIRESGTRLYVYAKPQIALSRVYEEDNRQTTKIQTIIFDGSSQFCDGYKLVLSPENNYTISESGSSRIIIRDNTTGPAASAWSVTGAEGRGSAPKVDLRPFVAGSRDEDACYYLPTRAAFR